MTKEVIQKITVTTLIDFLTFESASKLQNGHSINVELIDEISKYLLPNKNVSK
jgi:hypothetical protein